MSFRDFWDSYVETALWSSTDDEGTPLDESYSPGDVDPKVLANLKKEARDFYDATEELRERASDKDNRFDDARAGHDFWLTRNRHGAGFWDSWPEPEAKTLTRDAHAYGGVDLYVGDDGRVYAGGYER